MLALIWHLVFLFLLSLFLYLDENKAISHKQRMGSVDVLLRELIMRDGKRKNGTTDD